MTDEKLRRILEDKKLRMMLEEASPQQEIKRLRDEIARLREVITRAASHWLNLHPGVAWEGDIADAMAAATAEIDTLREAIRRLADQDATLSVQGGNVIVTMDATLTDAEREFLQALHGAYQEMANQTGSVNAAAQADSRKNAATLRGLLERLGGVAETEK